jgi:hypothetical protein
MENVIDSTLVQLANPNGELGLNSSLICVDSLAEALMAAMAASAPRGGPAALLQPAYRMLAWCAALFACMLLGLDKGTRLADAARQWRPARAHKQDSTREPDLDVKMRLLSMQAPHLEVALSDKVCKHG